jgi:hypothetical protein
MLLWWCLGWSKGVIPTSRGELVPKSSERWVVTSLAHRDVVSLLRGLVDDGPRHRCVPTAEAHHTGQPIRGGTQGARHFAITGHVQLYAPAAAFFKAALLRRPSVLDARQTWTVLRIAPLEPIRDAEGTAVVEFRLFWEVNIRLVIGFFWVAIGEISLGAKAFGTALIDAKSEVHAVLAGRAGVAWQLIHEAELAWSGGPAVFCLDDTSARAFPAGGFLVANAVLWIRSAMAAWWLVIIEGVVEAGADAIGVESRVSPERLGTWACRDGWGLGRSSRWTRRWSCKWI